MADVTITFGYIKTGQLLYPGAGYCGELRVSDIGFAVYDKMSQKRYIYEPEDIRAKLPHRRADSNKGSCRKGNCYRGSKKYGGAAVLSSRAALQNGSRACQAYNTY